MKRQTMISAEAETGETNPNDEDREDLQTLACCWPEIVSPPAESLGSVAMDCDACQKPDEEDYPEIGPRALKLPDVPGNVCGKTERLDSREYAKTSFRHHSRGQRRLVRRPRLI